jgi:DNA-directed RNA polymerase specialized sigma24 family protein
MTPEQFEAIAKLLRLRSGPAKTAAALHLVQGLPTPQAAKQAGCSYPAAYNACKRAKNGLALALLASGQNKLKELR